MDWKSAKLFLLLITAGILVPAVCVIINKPLVNQRAILYDEPNQGGSSISLTESYNPDLDTVGFGNRARSVCVTGIWLLYENVYYNSAGINNTGTAYVFGRNNYCTNIPTIGGIVSSVRYAGAPKDYTMDTFTLYQYDYFQGKEEYGYSDITNVRLVGDHMSIIITGNSHWTIYDKPNFDGNNVCLTVPEPGKGTPAFISNIETMDISVRRGTIRSVKKGCQGEGRRVTLQAFNNNEGQIFSPKIL